MVPLFMRWHQRGRCERTSSMFTSVRNAIATQNLPHGSVCADTSTLARHLGVDKPCRRVARVNTEPPSKYCSDEC